MHPTPANVPGRNSTALPHPFDTFILASYLSSSTEDSSRDPTMPSTLLRACAGLIVVLLLAPHSLADEAEAVKQLEKIGAYVITIGSDSHVTFQKTKATDADMKLLREIKNRTAIRFSET